MNENYVDIMLQSLKKKVTVLNQIIELNRQQKILLDDPNLPPESLEQNLSDKDQMIRKLNELDEGFEELYNRVKDELQAQRAQYVSQISQMQDLIKEITEKSAMIQTQELRNKEKAMQKFSGIRKQVKGVRNSQKVVKQYYQNMMKQNSYSGASVVDNRK
ncbi:flagellar protein FliT [Roseburia sp. BX1005]|uniref:Flagellar protein FliT n=1 Tax=Roseburia zhanii TaxID=2763064 RepID=A0A923LLT1_9FIRM|nr:flagellar protein FliT [Roseburia zhanii]MBC5712617.1 flagellar protein FliT [Roseburia zhanii]